MGTHSNFSRTPGGESPASLVPAGRLSARSMGVCAAAAAALFAITILSTSCGIVEATKGNMTATVGLTNEGFYSTSVKYSPAHPAKGQPISVNVVTNPVPTNSLGQQMSPSQQFDTAASTIWQKFPYHFDTLNITINGDGTQSYTHDQLAEFLGPRPNNLDANSLSSLLTSGYQDAYIGIGIVAVLLVAFIISRILRTRRHRSVKKPPTAGKYGNPEGHYHMPHHNKDQSGRRAKGWNWS